MELLTFILCAYGLTQILVYGKIFSRLRPNVTPTRFYQDEMGRINRTMGGRKGGKFASGGKFTRPVISNSTDRQSLINQIKSKIKNLTK